MNIPNLVGSKNILLDNTSVDINASEAALIDNAYDNDNMYPYAATSTVDDDYTVQNFTSLANDTIFKSNMKLCFGVFLQADITKGNQLYSCKGNISGKIYSDVIYLFPFIGQVGASSVTSSKASYNNLLDYYIVLPTSSYDNNGKSFTMSVDCEVIVIKPDNEYPLCFGFCFANYSAGDQYGSFRASLGFQKFKDILPVHNPIRI